MSRTLTASLGVGEEVIFSVNSDDLSRLLSYDNVYDVSSVLPGADVYVTAFGGAEFLAGTTDIVVSDGVSYESIRIVNNTLAAMDATLTQGCDDGGSGGTNDHTQLINRELPDQHPAEAISYNGGDVASELDSINSKIGLPVTDKIRVQPSAGTIPSTPTPLQFNAGTGQYVSTTIDTITLLAAGDYRATLQVTFASTSNASVLKFSYLRGGIFVGSEEVEFDAGDNILTQSFNIIDALAAENFQVLVEDESAGTISITGGSILFEKVASTELS